MGVMTTNLGAMKATVGIAAVAGVCAAGVYVYSMMSMGSAGFQVGTSPAKSRAKRKKEGQDAAPDGQLVRVFFGSQTGTAEDFAKMLAKDARAQGINAVAVDLGRVVG